MVETGPSFGLVGKVSCVQDHDPPLRVTRHSSDEPSVDYSVLQTPCTMDIPVVEYAVEGPIDGFRIHHVYVNCKKLETHLLPLDANPREPSQSQPVKKMYECLRDRPQDFVKKNNGVTLLADRILFDDKTKLVHAEFGAEEGVCNGGHTYFAIVTCPTPLSDDAVVHLEFIEFPPGLDAKTKKDRIVEISDARNSNTQLRLRSEADFLDYYDWFKSFLTSPNFVSWHENDSAAIQGSINVELYIRFLTALDPEQYYHPVYHRVVNDRHIGPVVSGGGVHRTWFRKMDEHVREELQGLPPLGELAAFGDDVFALRDHLSLSLRDPQNGGMDLGPALRHTLLYRQQMAEVRDASGGRHLTRLRQLPTRPGTDGCELAPTLDVLLIGLFRTNVWMHLKGNDADLVGWYRDPFKLWDDRAREVLTSLAADYKAQGNDIIQFIRIRSPYTNDLLSMVGELPPKNPEIVYDAWKGHSYRRADDGQEATHWLDDTDGGGMNEIESGHPAPAGHPLYKKVKDGSVRDMWVPKD